LESKDYPALYRESDSLAINAQKKHFWLVRTKIALLLVITGIMSVSWGQQPSLRTLVAIVLAISLVLSIAFTAIMNVKDLDRVWFSGRTIAESIKTETWSFMMKVDPYDGTLTDSEAEDRFLNRLDEILRRQPSVRSLLALNPTGGPQITQHMRQMRNETLENRRTYYLQKRIRDQRHWYAQKAMWNKGQESRWFVITWILELAAASIAIIMIIMEDIIINPIGIITTISAGILAWINARSYREPSESYGLAAQELALFEDRANQVSTEERLARLVLDVEKIITREHSIWLGRLL